MLSAYSIDKDIFIAAYKATATHRGSYEQIRNHTMILEVIAANPEMNTRWSNYVRQMPFAGQITFDDTIQSIMKLMNN